MSLLFRYKVVKTKRGVTSANITDLTPRTEYVFKVRAIDRSGGFGRFSEEHIFPTSAEVLKPEVVKNVRITSIGATQIRLTWDELGSEYSVKDYEILYRQENSDQNRLSRTQIEASNQFRASDLKEFTSYSFMVRARNRFGLGVYSDPVRALTLTDVPSGEPQSVRVFADSVSRLILQWKAPNIEDWNGQLTGTKISEKLLKK